MSLVRTCEREGCETRFKPRSAEHRFCSQPCRFASWVEDHPEWPEKRRETLREARAKARKRTDKRTRHDENERGIHVWVHDNASADEILAKVAAKREASR